MFEFEIANETFLSMLTAQGLWLDVCANSPATTLEGKNNKNKYFQIVNLMVHFWLTFSCTHQLQLFEIWDQALRFE